MRDKPPGLYMYIDLKLFNPVDVLFLNGDFEVYKMYIVGAATTITNIK